MKNVSVLQFHVLLHKTEINRNKEKLIPKQHYHSATYHQSHKVQNKI